MIFTERTIRVSNGTSSISSPIILYKGDKNIKIRFKIVDCPYTYSKNVDNVIETSEASYAQLIIKTPNNGTPILSDIAEPENGYVTFIITGEMIDEAKEVGKYSLQIRLLDDEQYGRITIPEVVDGIEVREPMVTEGVSTTNEADVAVVDYAVTTTATAENAFDSEGNYMETNWQSGNIITSAKLNKIEKGITGVNQKIANSSGSSNVDLTDYAKKSDLPTKTSQLTNDSNFVTDSEMRAAINSASLGAGGTVTPIQSFSSWLAIGDSITVGYNNNNYSYADIIAKKYGIYMVKDAVTGSNIASDQTNFGPGFVNRVDSNGADYNLITVMGGLNDFNHATVTLGTFNANIGITDTITSFYDGVTILCKKLITKYPNSKIVFLSSNRDNTYNNIHDETYEQFMEAIATVCSYFSIPFYRIDDLCGFNRDVYVNQKIDNGDLNTNDVHPKTLGHRKIAGAICDCISFVNPVDAWGKGTLNITQLSSTIASNASMADVRNALTVKAVYQNGIEFTITDYNITGNITEGTTTFTIDYRGITSTVTFTTGEGGGTGITPVYQMAEPYTVSGVGDKTYNTGYSPFTEQHPITIRISANITSFDNTNAMTLMSCSNPSAPVQFAGFSLYLSKNGMMTIYTSGSGTLVIPKNISAGEQLKWTDGAFDLFIVYDGNTTITVYVISNGNILEQRSNTSVTFSSNRWNDWTLKLFSTGTSATQGAEGTVSVLKVYDTAFTEQDVLNNI